MEVPPSKTFERWWLIAVMVVTWALSAGVNYGIISARLDALNQRLDSLENSRPTYVSRAEYNGNRQDLANRLDRIERKIDALN